MTRLGGRRQRLARLSARLARLLIGPLVGLVVLPPVVAAQTSANSPPARGLEGAYDESNPFARILRGELPASVVYEDEHVMAFLSIGAQSRGHTLVISKTSKARNVIDIEPEELARVMAVVQRVARAQRKVFHADGVEIKQNNGAAAGQAVFHLHVHVIPRYDGQPLAPSRNPPATASELDPIARELAKGMEPAGPARP
jgi:histidine triad (HIT) family protein